MVNSIEILNSRYSSLSKKEIISMIGHADDIIENCDKEFIFDTTDRKIEFGKEDCQKTLMGVNSYILSLSDKGSIFDLTIVNEEWTNWRNKGLTGTFYYKLKFKDEIIYKIKNKFNEVKIQLEELLQKVVKEDEMKEKLLNLYKVGTVYSEDSNYFDRDIVNTETKEVFRFVTVSIFDVGRISFPKRLQIPNGKTIPKNEDFTDEELRIHEWIIKNNYK